MNPRRKLLAVSVIALGRPYRGRLLLVEQFKLRARGRGRPAPRRQLGQSVLGHAQRRRSEGHRRRGDTKAAGLLSSLPFHASWSDFTSGPPMLEAMASGSVDVGGVGDAPPVFAASGGEAVEIVGAREVPGGDQDALVVPKGSTITSITQLKGKKIAYGSGSSGNYNLLTVLTKAGLTTKDVTMVNLQPAEALASFTSGSVDAWDIWPPYVQQVVAQDGAKVLTVGPQYGSPYSYEVASKAAVANPAKAAAIQAYLTTLDKAYVWASAHPNAWGAAGRRRPACPPASRTRRRRSTRPSRWRWMAPSPFRSRTWSPSSTRRG